MNSLVLEGTLVAGEQIVQNISFFLSEVDGNTLDGLDDGTINLGYAIDRIFIDAFLGEDFVHIIAEGHPLNPLFSRIYTINVVDLLDFLELGVSQVDAQKRKHSFELLSRHNVLSQSIEVEEELPDSDSLEGHLGLHPPDDIFDGL